MSRKVASAREGGALVSVVVPAWNAEATLARTLASVSAQTYRNIEILVVDDGSTDRTAEVAEEFCRSEPRARLIRKDNGGVASARNRGIAEASGDWIAPVDADDLWHRTKIEMQVAVARGASQPPGFVYCWRRLIDCDDWVIASGLRLAFEGSAFTRLGYINAVECGSSLLLSREAVTDVGGYDESLRARNAQGCEDMLLQLQVARRYPIAVVRQHLVAWRLHDSNMSSDFDQMARSCELVFDDLAVQGMPLPRQVERWAMARILFELAEERAAKGELGQMARYLATAIAMDPARSSQLLGYRAVRSVVWRLRGKASRRRFARFEDIDPAAELPSDQLGLDRLSHFLQRREDARLSELASREPVPSSEKVSQVTARSAEPA